MESEDQHRHLIAPWKGIFNYGSCNFVFDTIKEPCTLIVKLGLRKPS